MFFGGTDVGMDKILSIQQMPAERRVSEIHGILAANGGGSLHVGNQRAAAAQMLGALLSFRKTPIYGSEIRSIVKMAKNCW